MPQHTCEKRGFNQTVTSRTHLEIVSRLRDRVLAVSRQSETCYDRANQKSFGGLEWLSIRKIYSSRSRLALETVSNYLKTRSGHTRDRPESRWRCWRRKN